MRSFSFLAFVALTFCCWGVYGPVLHIGQELMGADGKLSSLRPFICVGIAYFLIAVVFPLVMLNSTGEKGKWSASGFLWSFVAGAIGAIGALGIILAFKFQGKPVYVMPLVFGLAPIVNTFVTMIMAGTFRKASPIFFIGILLVAIGAAGVLRFKPTKAKPAPEPKAAMGVVDSDQALELHKVAWPVQEEEGEANGGQPPQEENAAKPPKKEPGQQPESPPEAAPEPAAPREANSKLKQMAVSVDESDTQLPSQANSEPGDGRPWQEDVDLPEQQPAAPGDVDNPQAQQDGPGADHVEEAGVVENQEAEGPNLWIIAACIGVTALCWGAYGPVLHKGQAKMEGSRLRPFLCVGLAYFAIAVIIPLFLEGQFPKEPGGWDHYDGVGWSLLAGAAGAVGALGIIYAFNFGGKPLFVMPLVFGFAPVVNTLTETLSKNLLGEVTAPFLGSLAMVIVGAVMVLVFSPKGKPPVPAAEPSPEAAS